jgi:hypothetical protein
MQNILSGISGLWANALRNPKTTALGIGALVGSVKGIIADPTVFGESWWWATTLTAIGLLTSKDASTTGVAQPRDSQPPPQP